MKSTVEKLDRNRVVLEVEVEEPQVARAIDQAYKKLVRQVNIPGFRKGKVPRFIFERYVGKEPLYSEAIEIIIPHAYQEALAENKIEPIDMPQFEIVQVEEGRPFIFKATVEVKPEVKLGLYKGLEVTKPEVKVTEEDIDRYLKELQERYAEMVVVEEGPVQVGDLVSIDFSTVVNGEERPDLEGKDQLVEIGSQMFIPGFEEQLVGSKVGEEREIKITFPEDYRDKELAGKEAVFRVKVLGIKRKELKPIDDEFARDVSECENLAELREDIRRRLLKAREEAARAAVRNQAVAKAVEGAEVELPQVLVNRRLDVLVNELELNLRIQGLKLDKFLADSGKTMEELRSELRPRAELEVKRDLVLEAIAKAEGIEVTHEDLEQEIERLAQAYRQEKEKIKETLAGDLEGLKYDIMIKKAINFIESHCVVVPRQEEEKQEKQEKQEEA
ncbi:MAG: trigger factor [Clostridia bacterium]|nr:trigger factor [Clostridia bacterium]